MKNQIGLQHLNCSDIKDVFRINNGSKLVLVGEYGFCLFAILRDGEPDYDEIGEEKLEIESIYERDVDKFIKAGIFTQAEYDEMKTTKTNRDNALANNRRKTLYEELRKEFENAVTKRN